MENRFSISTHARSMKGIVEVGSLRGEEQPPPVGGFGLEGGGGEDNQYYLTKQSKIFLIRYIVYAYLYILVLYCEVSFLFFTSTNTP